MPRKPGNLNPEGSGRGSMPALGRSSQSTSAAANKRAGAGAAAKKVQSSTMKRIATKGFTRSEIDEFTRFAEKYYANQARLRAKFNKKAE